jgi:hypothetical protein
LHRGRKGNVGKDNLRNRGIVRTAIGIFRADCRFLQQGSGQALTQEPTTTSNDDNRHVDDDEVCVCYDYCFLLEQQKMTYRYDYLFPLGREIAQIFAQ